MERVRPAAVAGMFYPGDRAALTEQLAALLAGAPSDPGPPAKAYVLPHAGYIYSGSTAALGYAELAAARDRITRVVLLGPTHRVAVDGLALPEADCFSTPLGRMRVTALDEAVYAHLPQLVDSRLVHAQEHSLEVHVPFLQTVLGRETELIPLAVGRASPGIVAQVIEALWGGNDTIVIVSSDLSHYHAYADANRRDEVTVAQILELDPTITHEQACGATPLNGLLTLAHRRQLRPRLLGRCNSGDTAGDKERVVGYAALAFS